MIRPACESDLEALVAIGERFHSATGYGQFGARFSATKLMATLESHIASEDACVLVATRDDEITGVACAIKTQLYMSEDDVAVELYWWVNPDIRGGVVAIRLMEALELWSRENECVSLAMSSMVTISESPADSIYERRGYLNIEKSWIKPLL